MGTCREETKYKRGIINNRCFYTRKNVIISAQGSEIKELHNICFHVSLLRVNTG